ncbi:hypothetical protein GOP47_0006124 [Adiantum capillus-veneris]|uniref:GrpE protein homolog n=1 Tax=Adiantum capillus-veneris TaxID=13818 RepID=A0A9D4V393_ADICA|nr:hypothetical protein GOP47_0006124 [Adiantum capillus-veneris]
MDALAMAGASSSTMSSSLIARAFHSQRLSRLPSQRGYVFLPLSSCRARPISISVSAWQHRPSYTFRASAQADAKVVNEQQDAEASESEYESTDEESDGSAAEEASLPSVEAMLKKYREALSNNDEAALEELDVKFQQLEKEKNMYAKQVSTLNDEVLSLKERLLRLNADFDNFRKRSERDRIAVGTNVKGDVVNSLLPMVDNFERAKNQLKIETEGEQRIDSSYQGIYKQFVEIMKGLGVSVIETVGKEFDPNVHEAIMREESIAYAEGVVIEEFRRGFVLGDKLLRPAMVKVSTGSPLAPAPEPSESDSEIISEPVEEEATE